MSKLIRFINDFFKYADKKQLEKIESKILLTERQEKVFNMFYVKNQNIDFIADSLFVSSMTINNELKIIRRKLYKILTEENF